MSDHSNQPVRTIFTLSKTETDAIWQALASSAEMGQSISHEFARQVVHANAAESGTYIDDVAISAFADVMATKMAKKREQGAGGWHDKAAIDSATLSQMLRQHVEKGDPVDVANFAMMLHQRGERIEPASPSALIYPAELTPPLRHVLSKMCFEFISIAQLFRATGVEIGTRAEDEQAHCLHWLIKLVLEHGEQWASVAGDELAARVKARDANTGKQPSESAS